MGRINQDNHVMIGFSEIPVKLVVAVAVCIFAVLLAGIIAIIYRPVLALLAVSGTVLIIWLIKWQKKRMAKKEFPHDGKEGIATFFNAAKGVVLVVLLAIVFGLWKLRETIQNDFLFALIMAIFASVIIIWLDITNKEERWERQRANEVLESHGLELIKE